tara:strand:+ start:4522 stop:4995 length:474 start_codon:yes stop_codon:yes gene_type:complete
MKYISLKIIVLIFLFSSCGFKTYDNSFSNRIKITNVKAEGENRINLKIKDKLIKKSDKTNNNEVDLSIKTFQKKSVREKNNKNKITKYEINIIAEVKFEEIGGQKKEGQFSVNKKREFYVGDNNLANFDTEKREIEILTDIIVKEIYLALLLEFNDI